LLDPFRRKAVERISSPEELDRLVRVTRPRTWIALSGLLLVIAAVVLWSTLTTITTTVSGVGFVLPRGGLIEASTLQPGTVRQIAVDSGQKVRTGETIAVLDGVDGSRVTVTTPVDGHVAAVLHAVGDFVPQGGVLTTIEPAQPAVVESFVPEGEAKNARVGDSVWVAPSTASPSEYGYALGQVVQIGNYPIPDAAVLSILESPASARQVAQLLGPVIHVVIRLRRTPTPSGLSWTASTGPAGPVTLGTPAEVKIVTGERAPVDYVVG
jgi:multidrug efflux pump subunit AcrA (membrane-fusion protein)